MQIIRVDKLSKDEMMGRCVVALCGLPGAGKTILAKVVYKNISHLFDGCEFLNHSLNEMN